MSEDGKNTIQYLEAARAAVQQQQAVSEEVKQQEELVQRMENALAQEEKAVEESIELMTQNRREQVEEQYDEQVKKLQNQIKRIQGRRTRTKNKGMQSRIKEETADLRHQNSILKNEISRLFRQSRVPKICNTWVFYALYYPSRPKEILFVLLCFLVLVGGLPAIVWRLTMADRGVIWLALFYVLDVAVFGGLYLLVGSRTKARCNAVLRQGKKIRRSIAANDRQIRAIDTGIRRDTDEAMYGLEEFDEKLDRLERDCAAVLSEKKQALDVFDGETVKNIREEIMENNREHLDRMREDLQEAEDQLDALQERERYWGRKLGEKFGGQLGTEFLTPEALDALIQAFRDGAANMVEAQEIVRGKKESRTPGGKKAPA